MKNRPRISAHVAVAVPFALWAACGGSSSGGGMPGMGGTSGTGGTSGMGGTSGIDGTSGMGNVGAGGAVGGQAGGAGSAGTAGIGGQICATWIACCGSLGDTGCVSAAQKLEAKVADGTISEAMLEATCQGNLKILAMVNAQKCGGTGGSGDAGVPPDAAGSAGGGSGAGGSGGAATAGTTGSVDAGGPGGAGGASQAAWTCEEGYGTCACMTSPGYAGTNCLAGPYACCYTRQVAGGSQCTCTNQISAAICAMVTSGMTGVAHCPP